MKKLIILLIINIPFIGYAQIIPSFKINSDSQTLRPLNNNSFQPRPVLYYLNSNKFSPENTFIHPGNLKSIYIDKHSDTGKIYIITNERPWRYKTLNDVLSGDPLYLKFSSYTTLNQILYIDGRSMNFKSNIKIDCTFSPKVEIKKTTVLDELVKTNKETLIVNIWTTKKAQRRFQESIKKPDKYIYLRGDILGDYISH
jgi:hypothetical protein